MISPGALQRIDMLLSAVVEGPPRTDPPADPAPGQCFLVGAEATGAWAGRDGAIAGYSEGGWRFVEAGEGSQALVRESGETAVRSAAGWEFGIVRAREVRIGGQVVVSVRQPPIPLPAGGGVIDAECRAALAGIVSALAAHGLVSD